MTSNVELLPLPEPKMDAAEGGLDWTDDEMADYALANVLHHTAPLRYALDNAARSIKSMRGVRDAHAAEIEALRAEVRTLVRQNGEWQARAERLAEALRPLAGLDLTPDDFDQRPDSQPIYARNKTAITVGDVRKARPAADPAYDRELIARMLTEYNHGYIGQFSPVAVEHQIKLLREAENHSMNAGGG